MFDPDFIIAFLLIGSLAGLLAGLLGVGGGLVIVPPLTWLFKQLAFPEAVVVHCAVATSLATIVVTGGVSAYSHYRRGAVLLGVFRQLSVGVVAGASIGAIAAGWISSTGLKWYFGLFELAVAAKMLVPVQTNGAAALPGFTRNALVATVIGAASSLLGIGGGTITVPYLTWCGVNIRSAVATSAALGFPLAIAGSASFMLLTPIAEQIPDHSTGYVYWPAFLGIITSSVFFAPLGAKLAHQLSFSLLQRVFAIFLALLGGLMLLM